jgi:hypothetical protein
MGFWSNLFGKKKKQPVKERTAWPSRNSKAVARLARKRGCSIYDVDLYDDGIIEELLLLGLILSDDGLFYEDDPNWVDPVEDVVVDVTTNNAVAVEETTPELAPVEEKPLPPPSPEPSVYTPPAYEPPPPAPALEPERSSWTDEPSESSWGSSSDSGGGWSGGSDSGGGFDD